MLPKSTLCRRDFGSQPLAQYLSLWLSRRGLSLAVCEILVVRGRVFPVREVTLHPSLAHSLIFSVPLVYWMGLPLFSQGSHFRSFSLFNAVHSLLKNFRIVSTLWIVSGLPATRSRTRWSSTLVPARDDPRLLFRKYERSSSDPLVKLAVSSSSFLVNTPLDTVPLYERCLVFISA